MKKGVVVLGSVMVLAFGLYGCNNPFSSHGEKETTYDMEGAIKQMESAAVKENKPISIATGVDDKGKKTEVTIGFFADEEMMKSEKFYLVPEFFDNGEEQGNYIELTLNKEN